MSSRSLRALLDARATLMAEIRAAKGRVGLFQMEDELQKLDLHIKETARAATEKQIADAGNDSIRLRVDRPWRKWYEWAVIRKFGTKAEIAAIEEAALNIEVDRTKLDALVEAGTVTKELRQKAFREEQMTARVVIEDLKK